MCINKEKAELMCNGKCQISENNKETDAEMPVLNFNSYEFAIGYVVVNSFDLDVLVESLRNDNKTSIVNNYTFDFISKVLRPPTFLFL